MRRFKKFLMELRIAFLAVAFTLIGMGVSKYIDTISAWNISTEKITIARAFLNYEETDAQGKVPEKIYYQFTEKIHSTFQSNRTLWEKLTAARSLQDKRFNEIRSIFSDLSIDIVQACIENDTEKIREFIKNEQKLLQQISFFSGWQKLQHQLWTEFAIMSVLCLTVYWWRDSYVMAYWPLKKWWFWIYLVAIYPWSYVIGGFMGISILTSLITFPQRFGKTYSKYEGFCKNLNDSFSETQAVWKQLFFEAAIPRQIEGYTTQVRMLREKLGSLGLQMEKTEEEYAQANSALHRLKNLEQNPAEIVPDETWTKDLEDIIAHKDVQAVRICAEKLGNSETWHVLEIYTRRINALVEGFIGPLRIRMDMDPHRLGTFSADRRMQQAQDRPGSLYWSDSFCFGNSSETIKMHLEEHRPSLALAVIMQAFHASGRG